MNIQVYCQVNQIKEFQPSSPQDKLQNCLSLYCCETNACNHVNWPWDLMLIKKYKWTFVVSVWMPELHSRFQECDSNSAFKQQLNELRKRGLNSQVGTLPGISLKSHFRLMQSKTNLLEFASK